MRDQDSAIVRGLVSVAWADGVFEKKEGEMLEAILDAYAASDEERAALKAYASAKRSLSDIELQELSSDDRRLLLHHAVVLSYVDGSQSKEEAAFLKDLAKTLRIQEPEASEIIITATQRAKAHLKLL
ncbi:MAG: TerB family tellurite resistance protein [Polyangiaceae bacterium]|nr:TerB family tellurite resistance protein [Polyangiaceae bacterium]